jgi:hypothetical protein
MSICLYRKAKGERPDVKAPDFRGRLKQLALCCRGLELAVDDFCAGRADEEARRLALLAASVAEQTERLAEAAAEVAIEPLD